MEELFRIVSNRSNSNEDKPVGPLADDLAGEVLKSD
jgi:hypothetical protein